LEEKMGEARLWANLPCPHLPEIDRAVRAAESRALGVERGPVFYRLCLLYAQSKWREGKPAEALLQLNRAFAADVGEGGEVGGGEMPYRAVAWILGERADLRGQFMGNPRRHWQHYATRMSGVRAAQRTWRAWACWALARSILPEADFPADLRQLEEESLSEPGLGSIAEGLSAVGLKGELGEWLDVMEAVGGIGGRGQLGLADGAVGR